MQEVPTIANTIKPRISHGGILLTMTRPRFRRSFPANVPAGEEVQSVGEQRTAGDVP